MNIDFIDYISNFSALEAEAKKDISLQLKSKAFQKGQFIASQTNVCQNLYFLKQGLVKLYFIKEDGKEIVLRFFSERAVFTSIESFLADKSTPHNIIALEATEVDYLSKADLETLCSKYHSLERFYRLFLSVVSINMINRISEMMKDDAAVRYNNFISENKELAQRISLGELANYLGITQVSLSRIRAIK